MPYIFFIIALFATQVSAEPTQNEFDGSAGQTPYSVAANGRSRVIEAEGGAMPLIKGAGENNVLSFDQSAEGTYRRVTAQWTMEIASGREGAGFALLDTRIWGASGDGPDVPWNEPNISDSFAIGFDIHNPDDYTGQDRAHEVSLHVDGIERANALSPFDFRDSGLLNFTVELEFVPGGALVSVLIEDAVVYDGHFLAHMKPFPMRAAFGARSAFGTRTRVTLDSVFIDYFEPDAQFDAPMVVNALEDIHVYIDSRNPSRFVDFPEDETVYERVIMTLTLSEPDGGFDHWDRQAAVYMWHGRNRYEIGRYITPYRKGGVWHFEVTDFQFMMKGRSRIGLFIDTWVGPGHPQGAGWLVSVDLFFYRGSPDWEPFAIEPLWNGEPRYGDPNNPISNFFQDENVTIGEPADRAKFRMTVTGHGQSPNTGNAAEFIQKSRTLRIDGTAHRDLLWRDDCYLNPCRPQFGTWIFSRAGWCPGAVAEPWEIELDRPLNVGDSVTLSYTAEPYTNFNIVDGNPARHWVESYLVLYRQIAPSAMDRWRIHDQP